MIVEINSEALMNKVIAFRQACAKKYGIIPFFNQEKSTFFSQENHVLRNTDNHFKAFAFIEHNKIKGCIAAFTHNAMQTEALEKCGYLGMFDCIEDENIAHALIDIAIDFLKDCGCHNVIAPVNFSIWHSYRFMVQGFEATPLLSEPRNEKYYPLFFENYGFKKYHEWETQLLNKEQMQSLADALAENDDLYQKLGYKAFRMTSKNQQQLMENVYDIIIESYKHFPLFSAIAKKDFLQLYKQIPSILDDDCSWFFANPDGKFLGFILVVKDLHKPLQAMDGADSFWSKMKFLFTKKSYQIANIAQGGTTSYFIREAAVLGKRKLGKPMSIGAEGLYKAISSAMQKYDSTAISLMRDEGAIRNYAKTLTADTRKYALYYKRDI